MMENIHSETYSLLIGTNTKERKYFFDTVKTIPSVKCRADWADWPMCYITDKKSTFAKLLVAFATI